MKKYVNILKYKFNLNVSRKKEIDVPNLDKVVFARFKYAGNYDIDGE